MAPQSINAIAVNALGSRAADELELCHVVNPHVALLICSKHLTRNEALSAYYGP